mmetsp:Transcript_62520/g.118260  ORF Transcript_62520/g.118260 Transcript_62520/m.118260 type:complete len:253 (+) Transcript_62520:58-816(+)
MKGRSSQRSVCGPQHRSNVNSSSQHRGLPEGPKQQYSGVKLSFQHSGSPYVTADGGVEAPGACNNDLATTAATPTPQARPMKRTLMLMCVLPVAGSDTFALLGLSMNLSLLEPARSLWRAMESRGFREGVPTLAFPSSLSVSSNTWLGSSSGCPPKDTLRLGPRDWRGVRLSAGLAAAASGSRGAPSDLARGRLGPAAATSGGGRMARNTAAALSTADRKRSTSESACEGRSPGLPGQSLGASLEAEVAAGL